MQIAQGTWWLSFAWGSFVLDAMLRALLQSRVQRQRSSAPINNQASMMIRPAVNTSGAASAAKQGAPLDKDLRGYLRTNHDIVTHVTKPVSLEHIGALSAQSEAPILFENIIERPGFRICDILVKHRHLQARALGVSQADYLRTLAFRLRQPPRGFVNVETGPVKEVVLRGADIDRAGLPIPFHTNRDDAPYVTAMNIIRDPATGFYNSSQAGSLAIEPRRWLPSFSTPHTNIIIRNCLERGITRMPMAVIFGLPPAYEIMANFSGLHMDMWGEMEMVGTLMGQDIEMVRCESIDLTVPAHAEIIVEGVVHLTDKRPSGEVTASSMYFLPHHDMLPTFELTAVTMRADRPIYRNHQTCPQTDHQPLSRLCHEAMLYNRLVEMGVEVSDVRFPSWGGGIACIIQVEYPRPGFSTDALMAVMGAPWFNTKLVVAISPDANIEDPADVFHAIATRCDPARDLLSVPNARGSLYDPSAVPLDDHYPFRLVGKLGIDATRKTRHNPADFDRAWPKHWGGVKLSDFL